MRLNLIALFFATFHYRVRLPFTYICRYCHQWKYWWQHHGYRQKH